MASPKIKFKRSSVASKRPTLSNLELGEVALNTYDGKLFLRQDTGGVGIATTITSVNPWQESYGGGTITYDGNVNLDDNGKLQLGDGQDLQIYHNGTHSYIDDAGTGNLHLRSGTLSIQNLAGSKTSAVFNSGSGQELYYDNSKKFETTASGIDVTGHTETDTLNVSGVSTFQSHVHLGDDDELRFGASNDFKIVHDPNDCRFENSNGDIKFKNTGSYFFFDEDGGETLASFINDGAVNLFHAGSKKFATTGYGVTVTGIVSATSFVGDGSSLTNVSSNIGIQSASVTVGTGVTNINFTGTGLTVTASGNSVTVDIPSSSITRQLETVSGVTTDFTITGGYVTGLIDVYVNGSKQAEGTDFTATDGSTVTMTPFVEDGDVVEFQKHDRLSISGIDTTTNATNAYNFVGSAFYLPQYTTTARDAASFNEGAMIYNTTSKKINFYDGTNWIELPGVTLGLGMGVF